MSIHSEDAATGFHGGGAGDRTPMCAECGSDYNLVLHSISASNPHSSVVVEVGYSCTPCKRHYFHRADVAAVAALLNRMGSSDGVLAFGGHYIHCGQPMQKATSEVRRLSAPAFTDGAPGDALDVYLTTRVLHCPCGFQMELPE